ncbi:cation-translocating P-type ATPase [Vreelandella rituensis]|uniref:heavy metal translocating P-type ATPase n=1 Tax=Vreelandella rituensis TaxID=2282306 RepID=UPI0039F09987
MNIFSPAADAKQAADGHEALFSLGDMWCSSCALAVEARLQRLPEVAAASVHYPSATLWVRGAASAKTSGITLEALAPVVRRLGYSLGLPETTLDAHARLEKESRYLALRLMVASVFGMWTMLASLLIYAGAVSSAQVEYVLAWVSGAFSLPVVLFSGVPFYRAGWRTLRARKPGMDVLVSLGVWGAVVVSLGLLARGSAEVYFDTAVMLIGLLLVGRLVDTLCRHRGLRALDALALPQMTVACWEQGHGEQGRWKERAREEVPRNARIRVARGDTLPLDGYVEDSPAWVDLAPLTGESVPRRLPPGTALHAGCRNLGAALVMRVSAVAGECRLDRMREQMRFHQARKGELQRLADHFAAWLSPAALVLAAATLCVAVLVGVPWEDAMVRALSVLVVACPCAVGLAVPLASLAGSSTALGQGVVVRDPGSFETLAEVRSVAFDKTGTLTPGVPEVVSFNVDSAISMEKLKPLLAAATQRSEHPLAQALGRWAESGSRASLPHETAEEIPGQGRYVRLMDGCELYLGSGAWLTANGITVADSRTIAHPDNSQVMLGCDGQWLASFYLGEQPLPDAQATLAGLRREGYLVALISGDRAGPVMALGKAVGFKPGECYPGRSPEAKARLLQGLPSPTLYVGDGINDALGLASAGVGVACLNAGDAAREGAAVQLIRPGSAGVAQALRIARRTRRVMRQNLVFSALYNGVALGLVILMPIPPLMAVLAMVASSLSVTLNAARLAWREEGH